MNYFQSSKLIQTVSKEQKVLALNPLFDLCIPLLQKTRDIFQNVFMSTLVENERQNVAI